MDISFKGNHDLPLKRSRNRPMAQFSTDPAVFPTDATAINSTGLPFADASSPIRTASEDPGSKLADKNAEKSNSP